MDQTEDLKTMLQQFTKDSRKMMRCIQELVRENAELKAPLGQNDAPETTPIDKEENEEHSKEKVKDVIEEVVELEEVAESEAVEPAAEDDAA